MRDGVTSYMYAGSREDLASIKFAMELTAMNFIMEWDWGFTFNKYFFAFDIEKVKQFMFTT